MRKRNVPAVFGLPLMTPVFAFSFSPEGSLPTVTANVRGACPPRTRSVALYDSSTVAGRSLLVTRSSALTTVIEASAVAVCPSASETLSENEKEPAAVGEPARAPDAGLSASPGGIVPPATLHV